MIFGLRSYSDKIRRISLLLVAAAIVLGPGRFASSAEPTSGNSTSRALLIGCGNYKLARRLEFIDRDIDALRGTLIERGGYDPNQVTTIHDGAGDDKQPRRDVIEKAVTDFLVSAAAGDRIIVYFSGHGFRAADGKMYLAPIECNPKTPETTGISVQWLRERIAACPATFKLLILDACHAGSERSADGETKTPANSEDIGKQFSDLADVVTIASSTANQPSQIWDDKQHSLFTYWLNQGLKGNADVNGNGEVDIDELFKFVHNAVKRTSEQRIGRTQTPVRIVRAEIDGVPTVVRLKPQSLRTVIGDIADQLADKLIETKTSKVGVLEFINDTDDGEMLGKEFGLLGSSCAEMLHERLIDLGSGRFSVVDRRRLESALKDRKFGLAQLGSDSALQSLSTSAGGMPVLVIGKLKAARSADGKPSARVVHVRCQLTQTEGSADLGYAGGTAVLTLSEWAMIGKSAVVAPGDRQPEKDERLEDSVVRKVDERADGPHPLSDPKFPYRLRIIVDGVERPGRADGNDWVVKLKKGDVYTINVENAGGQPVAMRLLVDGLDTLPAKESTKGIQTWIIGKRVELDKARNWVLDPTAKDTFKADGIPTWSVQGFLSHDGEQNEMRRFTVVDAAQSLAARYKFSDQIGMITAGFYTYTKSGSRNVGTAAGEKVDVKIEHAEGAVGNPIVFFHIKYVEAK